MSAFRLVDGVALPFGLGQGHPGAYRRSLIRRVRQQGLLAGSGRTAGEISQSAPTRVSAPNAIRERS